MFVFFAICFILCITVLAAIINQHYGDAVNRREESERLAETVTFTHDPESWTLTDQYHFQQLCENSGWSELRSADEARDFRDFVEGTEQ